MAPTSPTDTIIVAGSTASIVDTSGNAWTISGGGQVVVDGVTDTITANTTRLAYVDGVIWVENSSNLWWHETSPGDSWLQGTPPIEIVPGAAAATVPFAVPFNINGIAGSSSNAGLTSLDYSDAGGNNVLMTQPYADSSGATGLPIGFGASGSTGDNVLQFGIHGQSDSATFAVPNRYYASVDVLALGINGGDGLTVSLNYADGTVSSNQFVPDWLGLGSLSRLTLWNSSIDNRGFGYDDLAFAADPSRLLTSVQLQSASGLLDVLGAFGNEAASVPATYSGDGTSFNITKSAIITIGTRSYGGSSFSTTLLNAPWNNIKSVQAAPVSWSSSFSSNLAYDNFVEAKLDFRAAGQTSLDVLAIGEKRGIVMLGNGANKFTWVADSNGSSAALNTMAIYTGDGNDTIEITAAGLSTLDDSHNIGNGSLYNPRYQGGSSIAELHLGAGTDTVTVTGAARLFLYGGKGDAIIHGGTGADYITVGAGGGDFTGGGGLDTFVLAQGSGHAVIEDFTTGAYKLDFKGLTSSDISTAAATEGGVAGLRISYDSAGDSVFLAHASRIASSDMIFT